MRVYSSNGFVRIICNQDTGQTTTEESDSFERVATEVWDASKPKLLLKATDRPWGTGALVLGLIVLFLALFPIKGISDEMNTKKSLVSILISALLLL